MAKNGKLYESDFEEALVGLFEDVGWEYTHGDNIYRKFTDPLIESDLRDYLNCRYGIKQLSKSELDGIVENLRLVSDRTNTTRSRKPSIFIVTAITLPQKRAKPSSSNTLTSRTRKETFSDASTSL